MRKFFTSRLSSILRSRGIDVRRAANCSGVDPLSDTSKLNDGAPLTTIFDVGANVGQSALRFAGRFPAATIHSFEPAPESYRAGVAATRALSRVVWHESAVGNANTTADFFAAGTSQTASLASGNSNPPRDAERRRVPVIRLDDFCEREKVARIDLLKTDTEGFDLGVLEGCGDLLSRDRVGFVLCEVGFSEADREHSFFPPIAAYLERFGWRLVQFYGMSEVAHFRNYGVCYADALFAKATRSVP